MIRFFSFMQGWFKSLFRQTITISISDTGKQDQTEREELRFTSKFYPFSISWCGLIQSRQLASTLNSSQRSLIDRLMQLFLGWNERRIELWKLLVSSVCQTSYLSREFLTSGWKEKETAEINIRADQWGANSYVSKTWLLVLTFLYVHEG